MATLVDFFANHHASTSETQRAEYFETCACYMMMVCWQKMDAHIQGFVQSGQLETSTEENLAAKTRDDKEQQWKLSSNTNLYNALNSYDTADIKEIMSQVPPLPLLPKQKACNNIDTLMAALKAEVDQSSDSPVYNLDTCVQFHHLLVAVLLCYGRWLSERSKLEKKEGGGKAFTVK
jgi:hypothetical protein